MLFRMGILVSALEDGRIDPKSFPGIQEGERVFYMFRSHWLREVVGAVKIAMLAGACMAVAALLSEKYLFLGEEHLLRVYIGIAILGVLVMLWYRFVCEHSRSYVTDRRFVRFEGAFLPWQARRVLFWKDATKTRSSASWFFLRMFKVGTLEVIPSFGGETQNIVIPYTYYYDDIASYIDKIIFTFNNKKDEIASIRDFVEKPRGKRYPAETAMRR